MIYKKIITLFISLFIIPTLSFAQDVERFVNTKKIFGSILEIVKTLIPIAFGLAVLFFFWGIAKFIWSAGSDKDEGKRIMVWGVVAIFVMSTIWGIVAFIVDTVGIDETANMNVPTINGGN